MTDTETATQNAYCPHCGEMIVEPGAFCGACGSSLGTVAVAAKAAGAPVSHAARPAAPSPAPGDGATRAGTAAATPAPGAPTPPAQAPPSAAAPPPAPPPPPHLAGAPPVGPAPAALPAIPGRRRWLPYALVGGAALLLAAVVTVLLIVTGGSPGKNVKAASATQSAVQRLLAAQGTTFVSPAAPGLFAFVRANRLEALVPAGWRATAQAGTGIGRAQFTDPKDSSNTLTVVDQTGSGGDQRAQAVLARTAAVAKKYPVSYFGPEQFPGGRMTWRVTYTAGSVTNSIYFFAACNGSRSEVVHVSAPTAAFAKQAATLGVIASSAEPLC